MATITKHQSDNRRASSRPSRRTPHDVVEQSSPPRTAAVALLADAGWDAASAMDDAPPPTYLNPRSTWSPTIITAEMGKPIAQSRAEVAKSALHDALLRGECARLPRGSRTHRPGRRHRIGRAHPIRPSRRRARRHAVELPDLAGHPLRGSRAHGRATSASSSMHRTSRSRRSTSASSSRAPAFRKARSRPCSSAPARVERVIRDPRVAAVTLTGSEGAGRSIGATAGDVAEEGRARAGRIRPVRRHADCEHRRRCRIAVKARTSNNGQACINAKRFIVHADIYDEFAQKFADSDALRSSVGDPASPATEIGPLATESGRRDIEELVEDAREQGCFDPDRRRALRLDGAAGTTRRP